MNRPRSRDFVLGARASTVLTTSATVLATLVWATLHTIPWPAPLCCLLLCRASFAARRRVAAWRSRRAEWDAMAGDAPEEPVAPTRRVAAVAPSPEPSTPEDAPRRQASFGPSRRAHALFIAWGLLVLYLTTHTKQGATNLYGAAMLLWLIWTALAFLLLVLRYVRQLLGFMPPIRGLVTDGDAIDEGPTEHAGEFIVAQCLPVRRDPPRAGRAFDVLPAYCRELLSRSAAARTEDPKAEPPTNEAAE